MLDLFRHSHDDYYLLHFEKKMKNADRANAADNRIPFACFTFPHDWRRCHFYWMHIAQDSCDACVRVRASAFRMRIARDLGKVCVF